jgi:decaprenylphospho-beta-D-ribofuranose 2-oxidase
MEKGRSEVGSVEHGEPLWGWGRHPVVSARELRGEDLEKIAGRAVLSRGLGRSYGDASLPPPGMAAAGSRLADRILSFDPESGELHAEAGLSLGEINRLFWPRRFSSPILPGTQQITLGGMAAADVHAKNHHVAGTFGRHVRRLKIALPSGEILWASREEQRELFLATLGGMGLTGHILEVVLALEKIPSAWIYAETERIADLGTFLRGLREAADGWPFTMGWIDCLKKGKGMGRGILFRGRWATAAEAPQEPPKPKKRIRVPIDFPSFLLNKASVSLFNFGVYHSHWRRLKKGIQHPEDYFHPLDAITDWNRCYGKAGFTQYQCVVPDPDDAKRLLERLTTLGAASFLCVIKDCGGEGEGLLSFPKPGTSIAVDIPVRKNTAEVVKKLNELLIPAGGRIYLAKDTFTTAEDFRAMEPRLESFLAARRRFDPEGKLKSLLSQRLFGDDP